VLTLLKFLLFLGVFMSIQASIIKPSFRSWYQTVIKKDDTTIISYKNDSFYLHFKSFISFNYMPNDKMLNVLKEKETGCLVDELKIIHNNENSDIIIAKNIVSFSQLFFVECKISYLPNGEVDNKTYNLQSVEKLNLENKFKEFENAVEAVQDKVLLNMILKVIEEFKEKLELFDKTGGSNFEELFDKIEKLKIEMTPIIQKIKMVD
jgi:hypothetical protein